VAVTVRVKTNLKITWDDSFAKENARNKAKIIGYQILFEKKDGSTTESKAYCDGTDKEIRAKRECLVPLLGIEKNANLLVGDLIRVKVKSINQFCESKFSAYNKVGQVTITCPAKMKAPTSEPKDRTRSEITVHWENVRAPAYWT